MAGRGHSFLCQTIRRTCCLVTSTLRNKDDMLSGLFKSLKILRSRGKRDSKSVVEFIRLLCLLIALYVTCHIGSLA
jgi:hypothetical protein